MDTGISLAKSYTLRTLEHGEPIAGENLAH